MYFIFDNVQVIN